MGGLAKDRILVSNERVVIADTGPVHYLTLSGKISVLSELFSDIC